ncbi:MAG: hypothetical protein GX175_11705 [Halanaerobiaceae bacterium]|nr:hypothetical protein [Halanaerobiaceae bacterium]
MRKLLRFFITAFIFVILGILGYLYINSQSVIIPDTPSIELDKLREGAIKDNEKETLEQLLIQKKAALERQRIMLEEKQDLLNKRRQEIENLIDYETERIRLKYQSDIDNYRIELENKYQEFRKRKEQEYLEQLMARKELYEEKLGEMTAVLEDSYFNELEEYRQELLKEYYPERINYDLKLKFLDLPKEEEDELKKRLAEFENKQLTALERKETELREEIENKIEEFKEEYNIGIMEYEQELKNRIERELNNKMLENNQKLEDYLILQQRLMNNEIEEKRKEILERSKQELSIIEDLVKEISREYFTLQSEVSILEKEVMY